MAWYSGLWAILIYVMVIAAMRAEPVETFLEAPGPKGPLRGTMLAPEDRQSSEVVLIIPGSGPTDRDGNSPHGLQASTYQLLAEGLAANGVANVRIDKRGMFASNAATADANAVTIADYADDVHSWISTIRERTKISCVWLLGHSEGGLVALVAGDRTEEICGLILASTAGRPLGDVFREQLLSNPANAAVLDEGLAAIAALEQGDRFDTEDMNPALLPLFRPEVQGFLIEAFSYNPAALLAAYEEPALILHGERDIQISVEDADRLSKANSKAEIILLPDTNHVLKSVTSSDRAANLATYTDPRLPLAPGIIEAIERFLTSHRRQK